MSILLRFLPHIAIAVAIIGAVWWFSHARYTAGYEAAEASMAQAVRKAEAASKAAEIEARKRVEAVDREYQSKLQTLDERYRDAPARLGTISVRQCPAGGVALSRSPEPAAVDPGSASADELSRNISADIERLLKQADEQTERLIACQAYAASIVE